MATTGTATLSFGATPTTEATVLVSSGLSGLTINSHMEAFVQGSDSTATNTVDDHKMLAFFGKFNCEYVSATSMNINGDLTGFLASDNFTVHWVTA